MPRATAHSRLLIGALVVAAFALALRAGMTMQPGLDYFGDASGAIDAPVFHSSIETVYFAGALPMRPRDSRARARTGPPR